MTTEQRTTSAPWYVLHSTSADRPTIIASEAEEIDVAHVPLDNKPLAQAISDARLIAAAPEMLEALYFIAQNGEHANVYDSEFRRKATEIANAAIAKAEGN